MSHGTCGDHIRVAFEVDRLITGSIEPTFKRTDDLEITHASPALEDIR